VGPLVETARAAIEGLRIAGPLRPPGAARLGVGSGGGSADEGVDRRGRTTPQEAAALTLVGLPGASRSIRSRGAPHARVECTDGVRCTTEVTAGMLTLFVL
jgi:hypothetical protein